MNLFRCVVISLLFPASVFVWGDDNQSERHPLDNFARSVLETYRKGDFPSFYQHTVFAMQEDHYKNFLLGIRNDKIRNQLTNGKWKKWEKDANLASSLILRDFKNGVLSKENAGEKLEQIQRKKSEDWKTACLQEWRKSYTRLKALGRASIREEAFLPVIRGAEKEGIQWETVEVTAVEVLHKVSANKNHFEIDGSPSPILYWHPRLTHRLQFDLSKTHGRSLRFSTLPEGPIIYKTGTRTEIGSGDLVVHFNADVKLNYFCPDQKGMGNKVLFSYGEQEPKLNVLVTFTYGNQVRDYRILLRDCLPIPSSASAAPSEVWNHWLLFERPVWLGMVLNKVAPE